MSAGFAVSTSARWGWVEEGRRVLEFCSVHVGQGEQAAQVERLGQMEDLPGADVELTDQQLEHLWVHVVLDLQPNWRPTDLATKDLLLQGKQQILGVVLLHLDIFVAGHPEHVMSHHLHAAEQLIQMVGDYVLQRDITTFGSGMKRASIVGTLTRSELANAGLRVAYQYREVDRQARDVREGM